MVKETTMQLLTREEFRKQVFARDKYKCVVCSAPAQDAHHIIERRLWEDSGYYLENGASLCGECHIKAEQTLITCEELRERISVTVPVLPPHLYPDSRYDKWGNIILPNGMRLKGELFFDESVQKILHGVLDEFCSYVKYPRTYHLPWSEGVSDDDRVLASTEHFEGKQVVATIKMDGENTSCYSDYLHARSLNGRSHPSRDWVKNLHSTIAYEIPKGWRVCGENLYAKHTIQYQNLRSYFLIFSIWNERNECLSWEDTVTWAELLYVPMVPVIYVGTWDEKLIRTLCKDTVTYAGDECEGCVVRLADSFSYGAFRKSVAKFVNERFRRDITGRHNWQHQQIIPNKTVR